MHITVRFHPLHFWSEHFKLTLLKYIFYLKGTDPNNNQVTLFRVIESLIFLTFSRREYGKGYRLESLQTKTGLVCLYCLGV